MRYERDENCPRPSAEERELDHGIRRFALGCVAVILVSLTASALLGWLEANAAVTTAISETYALRTCSTCAEIKFPTSSTCNNDCARRQCEAAALAEAQRVGTTRETGGAVYMCITRHNVIATFRPNASGSATLRWEHDGATTTEFRIVYWRDGTLPRRMTVPGNLARSATVNDLAPGTWLFYVQAVHCNIDDCAVSNPSNTGTKVLM
jgi:hypothetical protein